MKKLSANDKIALVIAIITGLYFAYQMALWIVR